MSVARPRTKKPNAVDETARVLRIFNWLDGEMEVRRRPMPSPDAMLAVAERIAARTEEETDGR